MNESNNRNSIPDANMEPANGNGPLAEKTLPRFDSPVHINVTSYRKRLTDTDGVSVKAALDAIVRAGILSDDTAKQIKSITFENRKSSEEKTIVEITDGRSDT